MACTQLVRTAKKTQLLPTQVASEQQSLVVLKKLLAIAVSGITYLRGLFPERAYGCKFVEEQKVMILREERSCPGASQIIQWMQGCFEAIQKKYLRAVILSIYTEPDHAERVTEVYQFKILYTATGPQMDFESSNSHTVATLPCGSIKEASILLIRKLYTLMQNLGPLPDCVCLNMKLTYYDDVTPDDYQPPGFKESDSSTMEFVREPVKVTMGKVATPFHTLGVNMVTERQRLEQVDKESACVRDKWLLTMDMETIFSESDVIEGKAKENPEQKNPKDVEVQLRCEEELGVRSEGQGSSVCPPPAPPPQTDPQLERGSDAVVWEKRTRSGRVIRSTTVTNLTIGCQLPNTLTDKTVSQYEMPNSQEVPQSSAPKKRKFSEPKDLY